ncbi:MAG: 30S ribosomal protein S19 [Phycisphaerae bacterium]|nr:30S ribosomal protein S19 [Phycisphaerae bacterium]
MARSLKKGPFVDENLFRKVEKIRQTGRREALKTWARDCTIVPEFVGLSFKIHNGRAFTDLLVTEDMVGHKLGEFSPTRIFKGHTNKKEGIAAAGPAAAPAPAAGGAKGGGGKK